MVTVILLFSNGFYVVLSFLEEQVRGRISEEKREQMLEKEQEAVLKEDKEQFVLLSLESSGEFFMEFKRCVDIILSTEKLDSPEEALKKQIIAVQTIQNSFAVALKIPEKKEEPALSSEKEEKEEGKNIEIMGSSPRIKEKYTPSSASFYTLPEALDKSINANPPTKGSGAHSQTYSGIRKGHPN